MATQQRTSLDHVWTIADAKARLSEILRLVDEEGPQRIGLKHAYIVVSERLWREQTRPRKPLGQWLVDNFPRGADLELPPRRDDREVPFAGETRV